MSPPQSRYIYPNVFSVVVTHAMGVRYEARPVSELVTQIAGDVMSETV